MTSFLKSLLLFFLFSISMSSVAQMDEAWRYYYPEFSDTSKNDLYLRVENNNFWKNTEYVSGFLQGYTYIGYAFQPSLMYYATNNLRLKVGAHVLQYAGVDGVYKVLPVLSVHAKLSNRWELIMGNLKGDVHHRLIEPVFNTESQYTRPLETGFQFLYGGDRFWMDTWIDWSQFIVQGDEIPEKFTVGVSSELTIVDGDQFQLKMPNQLVIAHTGGEISTYEEPVKSITNLVTGFKGVQTIGDGFIREVSLSAYWAGYRDLTKKREIGFYNGHGIYPVAEVKYSSGLLMLGYWQAWDFAAPRGSHVFQSIGNFAPHKYEEERQMITAKFNYAKDFTHYCQLGVMIETYYDLPSGILDYAYGMNLVFTPNFFLREVVVN